MIEQGLKQLLDDFLKTIWLENETKSEVNEK
jgi:hypothetical protein